MILLFKLNQIRIGSFEGGKKNEKLVMLAWQRLSYNVYVHVISFVRNMSLSMGHLVVWHLLIGRKESQWPDFLELCKWNKSPILSNCKLTDLCYSKEDCVITKRMIYWNSWAVEIGGSLLLQSFKSSWINLLEMTEKSWSFFGNRRTKDPLNISLLSLKILASRKKQSEILKL